MGRYTVGIDTGGTFTDLCAYEQNTGSVIAAKVPSLPHDPIRAVMNALVQAGIRLEDVERFVYGTTVATNAILEERGSRTALITTAGFEDCLEIMRINRGEVANLYDLQWGKPHHVIPRYLRIGVPERINSSGQVIVPLDLSQVRRALDFFIRHEVKSVAVCFLFSYINPSHEEMVRDIIRNDYPQIYFSISSDILREWREYERTSTTVLDAYVKETVTDHLNQLEIGTRKGGLTKFLCIMSSNAGITTSKLAKEKPILGILSGPAGGVLAGLYVGQLVSCDRFVTIDMGGTSTDVSLVKSGVLTYSTDHEVKPGLPIKIPMVDIRTIGAGGGSIGWIDPGGALKVGPQSAGAVPGPACYGTGGEEATVTDANVVLGRINPDFLLGGKMRLDADAARNAVEVQIGNPLNIPVDQASEGIIKVAVSNMAQLIRSACVERGYDQREFVLVPFGGAAGLHAAEIAKELGISEVVVPRFLGVLSAFGLCHADFKFDLIRTSQSLVEDVKSQDVKRLFNELVSKGMDTLRRQGHSGQISIYRSLDMRYVGQNYEINIPFLTDEHSRTECLDDVCKRFDEEHHRLYGFKLDAKHQIINLRTTVIGVQIPDSKPSLEVLSDRNMSKDQPKVKERRQIYINSNDGFVMCPIYDRQNLFPGHALQGPTVIEEEHSTVYLPPLTKSRVDSYGNLRLVVE